MNKSFARCARSAALVSLTVFTTACGEVEDAASDLEESVVAVSDAVDDAVDDWLNDPPLKQRHARCEREGGKWVKRIDVGTCEDGKATLHIVNQEEEQELTQSCKGGAGLTYEHQCLHLDDAGQPYFNDGPSTPHLMQALATALHDDLDQFVWNELFWEGAVNHDYCYHHGAFRNLTQADCDEQFHIDMYSVCAKDDLLAEKDVSRNMCQSQADAMFSAVRTGGADSYAAMSTDVNYPAWTPLWKRFGMEKQPDVGSTFTEGVTSLAGAF